MNAHVVIDVMKVLRKEFQHEDADGKFDPMIEVDILTLAQAAQTILETTSNFVVDSAAEKLRVRVSNLEAMNDNLRTNNAALRALPAKLRPILSYLDQCLDNLGSGEVRDMSLVLKGAATYLNFAKETLDVPTVEPAVKGVALLEPTPDSVPTIRACPRCGHSPATFFDGACQNCGEPSK